MDKQINYIQKQKKRWALVLFLLFISWGANAQNIHRTYLGHEWKEQHLEIKTNDGKYIIKPYSDKIVETSFIPEGETFNKSSHAVVLKPVVFRINKLENENIIKLITPGITVHVTKTPFQITYFYKNKYLISERKGYMKNEASEALDFNLVKDEVLFGGGARALGMNRRGHKLQLYNRAHYGYETYSELMNYTIPLVYSSKLYGIHFDNAPIGYLDLDSKKDNSLQYETISGRKTYQIIADDSWKSLIHQYTNLTGAQPLPPRWALGNFSSRFGYHSEKQTRETVAKFEEEKIPLDAVILDLFWFGKEMKGTMGNLEFLKDSFPNPQKMMSDFKQKGVNTILITEPFVLTTSNRWKEAVEKNVLGTDSIGTPYTYDFYFGNTGIIDIFKPEAATWFWNIYKDFINNGVGGWWGDLGEPEVHPSDLQHAIGSADEVHNIYGHQWAKLIYRGYQKNFPNQRPFILMRAGYSGSQRYGLIPWSGDVNRSWGGLQSQTEIALQMGMQGLGYMHSDLGGFAGNNLDNELYTRWLQYGVFQPIYRPHAQEEVPSEPVFKEPKTKALVKKAIELRYRLLPYNYTLAFENNQQGTPLMCPLFFEEPENIELLNVSDTYLWGNEFLIAPIVNSGVKEKEIYFPENSVWFDFYTDKIHKGGLTKKVNVLEEYIPTFVRAGAFVPMIKVIQSTKEYSLNNFELHYYHDNSVKESKGKLYNDDGVTPKAFEKGAYELLHFKSNLKNRALKIVVNSENGTQFTAKGKRVKLIVHNIISQPKKVQIGRNKVSFEWNREHKTLSVLFTQKEHKTTITIKLEQ